MDFDSEKKAEKKDSLRSLIMASLMGGTGIIIPFLSIFVATFKGVSEISMFNSIMLMLLSILIILFLIIRSAGSFFDNDSRLFISTVVFIVVNLISLIYNLTVFMIL